MATRLAFSIGLNTKSAYDLPGFNAEEAKRTWWLIYVQEVELSLDSGRPMSLQISDMDIEYPTVQVVYQSTILLSHTECYPQESANGNEASDDAFQVAFIAYLAEIAKIIGKVLKMVCRFP
jgi:hypothetical protein